MKVSSRSGTSVVELAICLPLLLMIVFGIIEFGLILYDKAMITNASREGARAGIVFSAPKISEAEIKTVVENYCHDHLASFGSGSAVSVVVTGAEGAAGSALTVTVTYPYTFLILPNLTALYGGPLAGGLTLTAQTVMRME